MSEPIDRLLQAKADMIDRMVEAGWILRAARSGDEAFLQFTQRGQNIFNELRRFAELGAELNDFECKAFWKIIKRIEKAI